MKYYSSCRALKVWCISNLHPMVVSFLTSQFNKLSHTFFKPLYRFSIVNMFMLNFSRNLLNGKNDCQR